MQLLSLVQKVTQYPPTLCFLNEAQKAIIEADFGMLNGQLVVPSRKALMKYVLQRYHIDPRNQLRSPADRGQKSQGTAPLADERQTQLGPGRPGRPIFL